MHLIDADWQAGRSSARTLAEWAVSQGELSPTFDYALPQDWVNRVHERTGVWPQELGMVWEYPESGPGHIFGQPYALTPAARRLLARLAS